MKNLVFLSLVAVLAVGLLGLREWMILTSIEDQKQILQPQLAGYLESSHSVSTLQESISSQKIYDLYLEPIQMEASLLLWSPLRQRVNVQWDQVVHQKIETIAKNKMKELQEAAELGVQMAQAGEKPSTERLLKVAHASQKLLNPLERVDLIENEIAAIRNHAAQLDAQLLREISSLGKEKLRDLRDAMRELRDDEMLEYLSSSQFTFDIIQPVVLKTMELKQSHLREQAAKQFMRSLHKRLRYESEKLMAEREDQNSPANQYFQMLRDEMEADNEISYQVIPPNPSSAN